MAKQQVKENLINNHDLSTVTVPQIDYSKLLKYRICPTNRNTMYIAYIFENQREHKEQYWTERGLKFNQIFNENI